jgi:CheY-like chemotaxis protein
MTALRILVIDDSLTIRKAVEIALRGGKHVIDYAASGQAGITAAGQQCPDLVLCDYVLPDMRGSDVCRAIARDARLQRTALVVMSGKQDQIRNQFADLTILDYLAKPFAAEAVIALVDRVAQRRAPSFAPSRETALALAASFRASLYEVLCERLARIPAWSQEIGAETPATFFARKLFTEPVLAGLFESLLPIYQQTRARIHDRNLVAEGSLLGLRPARVIDLAVRSSGTSELTFTTERGTTVFFVTGGRLYASPNAPSPVTEPSGLADALRGRDGRFTWRRLELIPPEVCGEPVHVLQLRLECLRLTDDLPITASNQLLIRCAGFSDRIRELQLSDEEQRVVTLIDGVSTVGDVARRAGGSTALAQQAIARMIELGLLRHRAADRPSHASPDPGHLVVVVDGDDDGFRGPLARYLSAHLPAAGLIAVDGRSTVAGVLKPRPTAVIINATSYSMLALDLADTISRRNDLSATRVVAVLDDDGGDEAALRAAGCDAVLRKPVHILDLQLALVGPSTAGATAYQP